MQLKAKNIAFRYDADLPWLIKGLNLEINEGERVGIIGPSGYGKSTLAKILSGYVTANSGEVLWNGETLPKTGYCPVQLIFQHPELSVNPRWKMRQVIEEGNIIDKTSKSVSQMSGKQLIKENLVATALGIEEEWLNRWSIELSGGELQRFCIARALNPKTKFLICDEISTMLDVITQAQIWKVLVDYSIKTNMGMLVITHNIELAKKVCTRIINIEEINNI